MISNNWIRSNQDLSKVPMDYKVCCVCWLKPKKLFRLIWVCLSLPSLFIVVYRNPFVYRWRKSKQRYIDFFRNVCIFQIINHTLFCDLDTHKSFIKGMFWGILSTKYLVYCVPAVKNWKRKKFYQHIIIYKV